MTEGMALAERPTSQLAGIASEEQRAITEVQASLIIAKRFPRDTVAAAAKIKAACSRPALAAVAFFAYDRAGQQIKGPTIRLLEAVAQCWGNLDFGIRELSQGSGSSEIEAYAWDMESNSRVRKVFKVPHTRFTRNKGNTPLVDPRDIYEMVANQGARRLRACLEEIIPRDVLEEAKKACEQALGSGADKKVLVDRVKDLIAELHSRFGITHEQVSQRYGKNVDALTYDEFTQLYAILNSLSEGEAQVSEFFPIAGQDAPAAPRSSADQIKDKLAADVAPAADPQPEPEPPPQPEPPPEPDYEPPAAEPPEAKTRRSNKGKDAAPVEEAPPKPQEHPATPLSFLQQALKTVDEVAANGPIALKVSFNSTIDPTYRPHLSSEEWDQVEQYVAKTLAGMKPGQ